MSLLNRVIDSASDEGVSTGNFLRQVITLGSRMKSGELVDWAMKELNGYPSDKLSELPDYRGPHLVPVEVYASGYFQNSKKYHLTPESVPDEGEFRKWNFHTWLYQPLAELEQLAKAEYDPSQEWTNQSLSKYSKWIEANRAAHFPDFNPISVRRIIPRTMLHGVIDTVRTRALLFALDLQSAFPDAGEPSGPTTEIQKVREAVNFNISNNIYGGNNTLANGENIQQSVQINQGDTQALLEFFKSQGLDEIGQTELHAAIEEDGDKPGAGVSRFLSKLSSGAIKMGASIATPAAVQLGRAALGAFFGVPIS